MIRIYPRALIYGEQRHVDEISPHRSLREKGGVSMSSVKTSEGKRGPYHRYTFKTKETLVAKVVWRLSLTYDDHVLDAYTIASIGIVTRLCLVMRF